MRLETPAEVRRESKRIIVAEGVRFFFAGMAPEVRMKHETLTALAAILPEVLAKVYASRNPPPAPR